MPGISSAMAVRPHLPLSVGYTTGKYYGPSVQGGTFNSGVGAVDANRDYYVPFLCRRTTTFDRIAIYNTAAVTINLRLGIFSDDGGGSPGTKLVDGGQLTTSGAAGDNAATISQQLVGGTLYWLAITADTNVSLQAITSGSGSTPGWDNVADFALPAIAAFASNTMVAFASRAYAAFPSTATAPSDFGLSVPFIRLRAA